MSAHYNLLEQHFRIMDRDSIVETYMIPGASSEVNKILFAPMPYVIEETGVCEALYLATIYTGRGNPTILSNVNAMQLGTYNNCWKQSATSEGLPSGDADKLKYRIIWRQQDYSEPTPPSY